jgi:CHAD domain-containing protein
MGAKDDKAKTHREVERKFVMAANGALPDLGTLPGVARAGDGEQNELDATYFDTATRSLTARGVTLRRRTGGGDAGWHLKRKSRGGSSEERSELRVPLEASADEDTVPDELAREVRGLTRGRPLEPVLAMHTERHEHPLFDADGATLALVADDLVTVRRPHDDDEPQRWHELEVELVDGDPAFLDDVTTVFEASGIHTATWPSKLRHGLELLGDDMATMTPAPPPGPKATVGDVVQDHLRTNVAVIVDRDEALRAGDAEAVHDVRVACRRLRSALATYRPFLDREQTEPLRDELKWFGQVLGAVRDADVLGARLVHAARELPAELQLGPVVDRLDTELRRTHEHAFAEATRTLDEPRTYALLDALDALVSSPPFVDGADRRARKALVAVLTKEIRRVRRAGDAVDDAENEDERLAALHELRKTAKRARYAAESASVVLGPPAEELATRMEDLQDALGEHQDTVTARAELRRIGALVSGYAGENGFSFGVLHEREVRASDAALAPLGRLRRRATKRTFDPAR